LSSPFGGVRWIWRNGQLVDFEKATVHVLAHALHYGTGVFEGIRCYSTPRGPAIFRLAEHLDRLVTSAKVYRMALPFTRDDLAEAIFATVRANELEACYVRPLIFRGFGNLGVNPLPAPIDVVVAAYPWGKYLGEDADKGVDVCVSSWRRVAADALPAGAKATGNYLNAGLIKMEALENGYSEGIALDVHGDVSEGSAQNVFLVTGGEVITPPTTSALLPGITRDAVITMARDMGLNVRVERVARVQLYSCDELFLTGTAVEIAPVRSVDRIPVGTSCPGEVTRRLMREFAALTGGKSEDRHGWLALVPQAVAAAV
jgi:branched-chain amino acid aminotransferase